jgi:hypothetical protein
MDYLNKMRITILLTLSIVVYYTSFSQSGPGAILPSEKEVPGWRTSGDLKIYNRDNMINLINGDAEYFKEFGVRYAVSRDYYNFTGRTINIQVYTFGNTFGSYGIFLQKSKGEKVFKEFGNACFENKGNFTFWKQVYLITMHSGSSGDTIYTSLRLMAGIIDSKIKSRGILPDILGLSKDRTGRITIFKGPLALSKIYYFGPVDVFDIEEGIAIENGDATEIILKYIDRNEAVRRFSDAAGILSGMSKFSGFKMIGNYSFAMKDKNGKILTFKVDDNCMNVTIK